MGGRNCKSLRGKSDSLEHDARSARPLRESERPGADRVRHDLITVHLDHFARDRAKRIRHREHIDEARIWPLEPHPKGVAIEYLQSFDVAPIVERLLVLQRALPYLIDPDDPRASRMNST